MSISRNVFAFSPSNKMDVTDSKDSVSSASDSDDEPLIKVSIYLGLCHMYSSTLRLCTT